MPNTNVLSGIRCPNCGQEDRFNIEVRTVMEVTDDGTDTHGDVEWEDSSHCECAECFHQATVKDFTIEQSDTSPYHFVGGQYQSITEDAVHKALAAVFSNHNSAFNIDDDWCQVTVNDNEVDVNVYDAREYGSQTPPDGATHGFAIYNLDANGNHCEMIANGWLWIEMAPKAIENSDDQKPFSPQHKDSTTPDTAEKNS